MKEYLEKCANAYYNGIPIISDAEFDYLAKIHNFNQLGSAPPVREGTIPHFNRLYSLDKYYEGDKLPFNIYADVIPSPKLDGSAISLTYINGKLITAATRGDGFIGEDVTNNFKNWNKIPQIIELSGIVQIVGEVVAPKTIENARNYAAGATRLKDPDEFIKREIDFIVYHLFQPNPHQLYSADLLKLKHLGFKTVHDLDLEEIYPTDGIVYRYESNKKYLDAGFTSKHPKGAFALKDSSQFEIKETELLNVIWQVGKSGKVTPVAIFNPVIIEDATVNKATLHNAGFIEDMDLYIGDIILITRAGGIIPKVLGKAPTL